MNITYKCFRKETLKNAALHIRILQTENMSLYIQISLLLKYTFLVLNFKHGVARDIFLPKETQEDEWCIQRERLKWIKMLVEPKHFPVHLCYFFFVLYVHIQKHFNIRFPEHFNIHYIRKQNVREKLGIIKMEQINGYEIKKKYHGSFIL